MAPATSLAIQAFEKSEKADFVKERAEKDLKLWLSQIPREEMDIYVQETTGIQRRYELKKTTLNGIKG